MMKRLEKGKKENSFSKKLLFSRKRFSSSQVVLLTFQLNLFDSSSAIVYPGISLKRDSLTDLLSNKNLFATFEKIFLLEVES
jgi:hypothetical protein